MKDTTETGILYPFSYRDAVEVLKLVKESEHCQSLDLSIGDIRLSLTRVAQQGSSAALPTDPQRADLTTRVSAEPTPPAAPAQQLAKAEGVTEIVTPTLGVFYRSPSPGAAPFVKEGDTVSPEDQIGLLEVMKLYMPITAGVAGHVTEILATDGALVEHGQVLMLVQTD